MELKTTPTSPRARRSKEIEKLYQEGLSTIERPTKSRSSLVLSIVLAALVGVLGSAVGLFVISQVAPDLQLFGGEYRGDQVVVRGTLSAQTVAKALSTIQPSLVMIFPEKPTESADSLEQVYLPAQKVGNAVVLSTDGWLVTDAGSIADLGRRYVAVDSQRTVHPVEQIIADPATRVYYLKVSSEGLTPAGFEGTAPIAGDSTIAVSLDATSLAPIARTTALVGTSGTPASTIVDALHSTERLAHTLELAETLPRSFGGAALVSNRGELVGVLLSSESGVMRAEPVTHLSTALKSVLEHDRVRRPALGVHYLDLATTLNVPLSLTDGAKQGVLVIGLTDQGIPAVESDSAAAAAELSEHDIITAVNGTPLDRRVDLAELVQSFDRGTVLTLGITRQGSQEELTVTLGELE